MGHHGHLMVGPEDLNSHKVTEIQKKGVFKSQISLVPANDNRLNVGRKRKMESG